MTSHVVGRHHLDLADHPQLEVRPRAVALGDWLPDTAWEDQRIRAFVASRYLVSFPAYGKPAPDPSRLPPPADEILREGLKRCVTTDEARRIVEGFDATGESPSAFGPGVYFGTDVYVHPRRADVMYLEPILPHGSCRWAS